MGGTPPAVARAREGVRLNATEGPNVPKAAEEAEGGESVEGPDTPAAVQWNYFLYFTDVGRTTIMCTGAASTPARIVSAVRPDASQPGRKTEELDAVVGVVT